MTILPFASQCDSALIGQLAERRLRESPYFFLRFLHCHVDGDVITLVGRVPHGQLKQFAETIVARIDGVRRIVNQIEVYDPQRASA